MATISKLGAYPVAFKPFKRVFEVNPPDGMHRPRDVLFGSRQDALDMLDIQEGGTRLDIEPYAGSPDIWRLYDRYDCINDVASLIFLHDEQEEMRQILERSDALHETLRDTRAAA